MPLNEQQQRVIGAGWTRPLKIIAGAGTGKTETLAARFVELVRQGLPPDRILLLTFTEEAAAEMRLRVVRRLDEADLHLPPYALMELWCMTFHGFAMRMLRDYGWVLGLPPEPRVVDEQEQQAMLDDIITLWEDRPTDGQYDPLDHQRYAWETGEAWNRARAVFGSLRGSGGTLAELEPHPLLREQQEAQFADERAQLTPLIAHLYHAYHDRLEQAGILDHDEQIARVRQLFELLPQVAERFAVVMVDEFQDTNRAQLDLLRNLCADWSRVTVVGDPRQAIYGWRAARPDTLRQFPFTVGGEHHGFSLRKNYRSRRVICDLANLALVGSEFAEDDPLEAERAGGGASTEDMDVALYLVPTVEDEARLVASDMARLIEQGIAPRQIALLLRARTHLPLFTAALAASGVPFTVSGSSGFFRQPAVRLIAALLQWLVDPEERSAAAHLWESPVLRLDLNLLRFSAASMETGAEGAWWQWLDDPGSLPMEVPDRARILERLSNFRAFATDARARMLVWRPADFMQWLIAASGLLAWWRDDGDGQAIRDVDKLISLAAEWTKPDPALTTVDYAMLLRQRVDEQPREAIPSPYAPDAVELSTVHNAKGREWPVVFVADTALPSTRARQVDHVLWDEQWKLVISDGQTRGRRGSPDPLSDLRRDLRRRSHNEERAIWYVALTRARDRLIITHSRCQLDEHGHFTDAAGRVPDGAEDDKVIHFFHELWELVRADATSIGLSVFRGPGPCSGALERTPFPGRAPTKTEPIPLSSHLQDAWERAVREQSWGSEDPDDG